MAERKFRSWVGFKEETVAAPTENAVERIRQLETQLADLRSRRDITSLSKEEFEELRRMVEDISYNFDYNHNATADCIEVISKAIKHIGKRLEKLEDYVYNEMDENDIDDNYIN